ncbi:MAG: hypothetical protein D6732_14425 [Methanobacteriota archaeon]|nr:MAG: hypothetical protein D6732_14425 [Euryarchaeota archaeon]
MTQLNWQKAYLTDNPFVSTPPIPSAEVIWADMAEQKRRIEERLRASLVTSPYTLVLNWGSWGGGKTHAARYFSQESVLGSLSREVGVASPLSLIVNIPRGTKDVIKAIYLDIMGALGIRKIGDDLRSVANNLGNRERFLEIARAFTRDEDFALAVSMLAGYSHQQQSTLLPTDEPNLTLKRYFLLSATANEIKELRLGRRIESGSDMIAVLTAIFNLLLYSDDNTSPHYSEIIIWFDEMEEILSLPGKEQVVLTSLIRDFTDYVPANLTIFINFSPRPGGKIEDIGGYLTPAVWSRVREQIFFGELNDEDMLQYVRDLLNAPKFRPESLKANCPDDLFPFDESALRLIYEILASNTVPRHINEACSLVIERALVEGVDLEKGRIDADFVRSMEKELQLTVVKGASLR